MGGALAKLRLFQLRENRMTPDQKTSDSLTTQKLALDEGAIEAAKQNLSDGAVTPGYGPWRDDIVQLLNDQRP